MLGAHYRLDTIPTEVVYDVMTIIIHPDYDSSMFSNDIALLELDTAVVIDENIRPVCAPDPDDVYEGTTAEISGWGTLTSGKPHSYVSISNLDRTSRKKAFCVIIAKTHNYYRNLQLICC